MDVGGMEVLQTIKQKYPETVVIVITGYSSIASAIETMKSGAFDYVMKPCDIDDLVKKLEEAFEKVQKMEEKIRLAQAKTYMKSPREILKHSGKEE